MVNEEVIKQTKYIQEIYPDLGGNIEKAFFYIKDQYNFSPMEMQKEHSEFIKYYKEILQEYQIYDNSSQSSFEKKIDDYFDIYSRGTHRGRTNYYTYNLENEEED